MGIPRIRHLRHRELDRVRHQDNILEFIDERVSSSPVAFPDNVSVWAALQSDPAVVIAAVSD